MGIMWIGFITKSSTEKAPIFWKKKHNSGTTCKNSALYQILYVDLLITVGFACFFHWREDNKTTANVFHCQPNAFGKTSAYTSPLLRVFFPSAWKQNRLDNMVSYLLHQNLNHHVFLLSNGSIGNYWVGFFRRKSQ